jgi:hypothetical protein
MAADFDQVTRSSSRSRDMASKDMAKARGALAPLTKKPGRLLLAGPAAAE